MLCFNANIFDNLANARQKIEAWRIEYNAERGFEGVLSLRAEADGVRLHFNYGKELPDPAGVLQGSATQTRWISLEGTSSLAQPEVAQLIEEAIARHRVPFAPTGRGPLVIRPTAAGRRGRG